MLAFGTQVQGFKPGRSRRIFQGEKILSTPSLGREVKPFVPCRRFTACKRSLNVTWKSDIFRLNSSAISRPSSSSFHYYGVWWRHLGVQVGRTKDQGLYNKPSAAVHPGALAAGTLPQYNTIFCVKLRWICSRLNFNVVGNDWRSAPFFWHQLGAVRNARPLQVSCWGLHNISLPVRDFKSAGDTAIWPLLSSALKLRF